MKNHRCILNVLIILSSLIFLSCSEGRVSLRSGILEEVVTICAPVYEITVESTTVMEPIIINNEVRAKKSEPAGKQYEDALRDADLEGIPTLDFGGE